MASVPTPEAPAAVLVGEDEKPLSQVAGLILEVNEARQRRVRRNLHGKVYNRVGRYRNWNKNQAGKSSPI
jgi:hypothetical protein